MKNERYGQALEFLDQARSRLDEQSSERFYAAEIYRLLGETHMRSRRDLDQAERFLCKGLEVAREQKAKSLELKVCMSMHDLYELRHRRRQVSLTTRRDLRIFQRGFRHHGSRQSQGKAEICLSRIRYQIIRSAAAILRPGPQNAPPITGPLYHRVVDPLISPRTISAKSCSRSRSESSRVRGRVSSKHKVPMQLPSSSING